MNADSISRGTKEVSIHSEDATGHRSDGHIEKTVDLEKVPHASQHDLATLAYAIASSAELHY